MAQAQRGRQRAPPSANGQDGPRNEIDLYELLIRSSVNDPFLSENNLGLGNYSSREFWQQVDSFKKGLYAEAAFSRLLFDRAVYQTKCELAKAKFEEKVAKARKSPGGIERSAEVSENHGVLRVDGHTKNEYIAECGERLWNDLGSTSDPEEPAPAEAKLQALEDHAGLTREWTPPHHRMIMARHEASRSRFARLIDNVTGRIREIRGDSDGQQVQEQLGGH